ncbi:MAG: choice-of-anchor D domain-containing protein [Myxococcota bacterium]
MRFVNALVLTGLGCSDYEFDKITDPGAGDGALIEVDPASLNFGIAGSDDDPVVQTFTVYSVGVADLEIDSIELVGDGALSYAFVVDPGSFVLPPGASQDIEVIFDPVGAAAQTSQALVHSSDINNPHVPVNLFGEGAVSELQITPDPLNFGTTYVGCPRENEVLLTNIGTEPLDIFAITQDGETFSIVEQPALPVTLQPNEETIVYVQYDPASDAVETGELTVVSSEPMGVRTAEQLGEGAYGAYFEQLWNHPVDPPTDIIFSVDQSCSMDDDVSRLANNFNVFINELSNYSSDWQIMVVNGDDGCSNSGILRPQTNNYSGVFSNTIQNGGGGSYTEKLLTITSRAVENTDQNECNAGFMRPNSLLHIVMVSDEPEQSNGSWDSYLNQVIAKKGNPANVRMSSIAGDYPSGCGSADPGDGYYQASQASGGVFLSICGDWSSPSNLQLLAEASVVADSYPLDHPAVGSTVEVMVNGQPVTSGWYYDSGTNSVIFENNPPEEGDTIKITYAVPANCD